MSSLVEKRIINLNSHHIENGIDDIKNLPLPQADILWLATQNICQNTTRNNQNGISNGERKNSFFKFLLSLVSSLT